MVPPGERVGNGGGVGGIRRKCHVATGRLKITHLLLLDMLLPICAIVVRRRQIQMLLDSQSNTEHGQGKVSQQSLSIRFFQVQGIQ